MSKYPFRDPTLSPERRIDDLLIRMSLAEKLACFGTRPDVPRLGIAGSPHIEGYHGVAQGGPSNWGRRDPTPTTQFPQAYGLGSPWDPELVQGVAAQLALEARALFQRPGAPRGGLVVRAPNAELLCQQQRRRSHAHLVRARATRVSRILRTPFRAGRARRVGSRWHHLQ